MNITKELNKNKEEKEKMKNTRRTEKLKSIKQYDQREKGITLVALVVTIVVLLILAGVTITALLGDDGIIKKAQDAANLMNDAVQSEQNDINALLNELDEAINGMGTGGTTPPGGDGETTLPTDGSFNETKGVNTPKLGANMTLVKFDTETQDWGVDETN